MVSKRHFSAIFALVLFSFFAKAQMLQSPSENENKTNTVSLKTKKIVDEIKNALIEKGYKVGAGYTLTDSTTRKALSNFQRDNGIPTCNTNLTLRLLLAKKTIKKQKKHIFVKKTAQIKKKA